MKIRLKKGRQNLDFDIPEHKILGIITGNSVQALDCDTIKQILSQGIRHHSPHDIAGFDTAVIIPDHTRLWARGDIFVPVIVKTLLNLGVTEKKIRIIIALGTHDPVKQAEFPKLAGSFCADRIKIINSANKDRSRLVYFGTTHRNTPVHITREAAEADHIIIFGGILHHMAAGFAGARKYIMPGIAGYESICCNHSLAMDRDGSAHPFVCQARLEGNPVHEDMTEAADMFLKDRTCTYAAIAADGTGEIFYAKAGPLKETFEQGCRKLDDACTVKVDRKADFVIVSAGGHRTDEYLYQAVKALFNAAGIVKKGGRIIFVAGCSRGVGNTVFGSTLAEFKDNPYALGRQLSENFIMPAYVGFRIIDLLKKFRITLVSDLSRQDTQSLGFLYTKDPESCIRTLEGSGYIIPFGENILPLVKEQENIQA